jgi:hypothetical protein
MFAGTGYALAADVADDPGRAAGYRDEAFRLLGLAIEKGYADVAYFESDPDLDPISADPRFQELRDAVAAKASKPQPSKR